MQLLGKTDTVLQEVTWSHRGATMEPPYRNEWRWSWESLNDGHNGSLSKGLPSPVACSILCQAVPGYSRPSLCACPCPCPCACPCAHLIRWHLLPVHVMLMNPLGQQGLSRSITTTPQLQWTPIKYPLTCMSKAASCCVNTCKWRDLHRWPDIIHTLIKEDITQTHTHTHTPVIDFNWFRITIAINENIFLIEFMFFVS